VVYSDKVKLLKRTLFDELGASMKIRLTLPAIFAVTLLMTPQLRPAEPKDSYHYPPAKVEPITEKLHGVEVKDPYRWLEDANNAEVKKWVEEENALTRSVLDKLPGREVIHHRLGQLLEIGSISAPTPVKGRYFYSKRAGKENQPIHYVREGLQGKDRVLLDPNTLAKDGATAVDWTFPSHDGKLFVYGLSTNGNEQSTLHIRNVDDGKDLPDVIERTRACSLAWLPDNKGFYYTRFPAPGSVPEGQENYNRHVFLHKLGDDPAKDPKVFGEGRLPEDWPNVALSPDGHWLIVVEEQGWAKAEVYFKDCQKADAKFQPLVEKVEARFDVIARNDRFLVHTNEKAPRYRLMEVDPEKPDRASWKVLIPEEKDVLESVAAVGNSLVAQYSHKATSRAVVFDRDGKKIDDIGLPTLGSLSGLNGEWDGNEAFYAFQSFAMAPTIYRLDLKSKKTDLWQQVKAGIDFDQYEVEQVTYPSKDKTPITMFLAHKKGLQRDGNNPTLLYGYGGFNINLSPAFNASRFLFLEKGGLLAIANLRGGGEYGEKWHEAGMLGNKQNVFDDFIAAAEWLIGQKYTNPKRLGIQGGSNGGLLVGAALTQRPDFFKAVVCQVPLLDMLRYHKFLIARLWIPEFGSPDNADQFKWLEKYSPYHHVKDGAAYPAVLLEAAESDSRVDALHARKMAARLQAATSSSEPILLRLESKAGHGAGKPRAKIVDELTDVYSFLFWQLGM
jgi:prolyl oligopeptidase